MCVSFARICQNGPRMKRAGKKKKPKTEVNIEKLWDRPLPLSISQGPQIIEWHLQTSPFN